jgi:osmotically-inducible protein OsmY
MLFQKGGAVRKFLVIILLCIGLSGCISPQVALNGTSVYDIYTISVETRSLWAITNDKRIKLTIQTRFADMDSGLLTRVGVESFHGTVYLVGTYENGAEKKWLEATARAVSGVRTVVSHLIRPARNGCSYGDDLALLADVKSRLFQDKYIYGSNIHVHTTQCHIVLTGIVHTKRELERAEWIAKHTTKARSATSYLRSAQ